MEFTFYRRKLLRALKLLEPYTGPATRHSEYLYTDNEKERKLELPEPYFGDKVMFSFSENKCYLLVFYNKTRVCLDFRYDFDDDNEVEFFMPITYLRQKLEDTNVNRIIFKEEKFFGFLAYDADSSIGNSLFEVEAFSTRKYIDLVVINPGMFLTTNEWLINQLQTLYKYSENNLINSFNDYIWFRISNEVCTAFATNGRVFGCKRENVNVKGEHEFCILGKDSVKIIDTLNRMYPSIYILMGYEQIQIQGKIKGTGENISITNYVSQYTEVPNWVNQLLSQNDFRFTADVKMEDLKSITEKIFNSESDTRKIFFHFYRKHLNVHSEKRLEEDHNAYISEFYDIASSDNVLISFDVNRLKIVLDDIKTETIHIQIADEDKAYFLNDNEMIGGSSFRLACCCCITDFESKWVECRDNDLAKYNKFYRNKYLKE